MKWDIDRELARLEPESCPGTTLQRATLDVKLLTNGDPAYLARYGGGRIKPTPKELEQGWVRAWSLALGFDGQAKAFFYDRTIRGVYLQARKAAKLNKLAEATPWGRQAFIPPKPKAKNRGSRAPRSRTGSPAIPPG